MRNSHSKVYFWVMSSTSFFFSEYVSKVFLGTQGRLFHFELFSQKVPLLAHNRKFLDYSCQPTSLFHRNFSCLKCLVVPGKQAAVNVESWICLALVPQHIETFLYSKHSLSFPWPFIIFRFHCTIFLNRALQVLILHYTNMHMFTCNHVS